MKKALMILALMAVCGSALAQLEVRGVEKTSDYWVYVRLEDRSGVTAEQDAGRSKAGDVVAVLPVNEQNVPSETEKKEWLIYKTALTDEQVKAMKEPWKEQVGTAKDGSPIMQTVSYRKNKIDTSKLGVEAKKGLIENKIDASKIEMRATTLQDLSKYEAKRKFYAYIQRPLIRIANVITRRALAETISTCNKSGEDYNSITLWEDATDNDLVTATNGETLEVYDDQGALDEMIEFAGATTNSSYYRTLTVPEGERSIATFGDGARLVYSTSLSNETLINVNESYFVFEYLEVSGGSMTEYTTNYYVYMRGTYSVIRYTLIGNITASWHINGIVCEDYANGKNIKIYGNIVANILANNTTAIYTGFDGSNTDNNIAHHNTVYNIDNSNGTDRGINCASDSSTCYGNLVYNAETDFSFHASATHDYNGSSDSTATGAHSINTITSDDFVSSSDFHLASGSDAIDAGTDLGSPYDYDLDGDYRDTYAPWDIGADEYAGGSPPAGRTRRFF